MKEIVIILILLTLGLPKAYSQEFSKNSVFVGLTPLSIWSKSTRDGYGINWTIGYQKKIWKDRLRLAPNLSFGNYNSKGIDDTPKMNVNSTTLKTNLNFDVLKIKSFSVFIGSGLTLNHSSGLSEHAGYFNSINFAVNGLLGFKIKPKNKRFNYELLIA